MPLFLLLAERSKSTHLEVLEHLLKASNGKDSAVED